MVAWDTTLVSRLHPGGTLERELIDRAHAGDPVAIAAPTVMEVVRGLQASATGKLRFETALTWFTRLVASDLVEVLALDWAAAIVAGRVRAAQPTAPTGIRRKGTKPEQRAGWVFDIQIASCAWAHGRELATENQRDFVFLRELIAELYPEASPLVVLGPPPA